MAGTKWILRDVSQKNPTFVVDRVENGRVYYTGDVNASDSVAEFIEAIHSDHIIPVLES